METLDYCRELLTSASLEFGTLVPRVVEWDKDYFAYVSDNTGEIYVNLSMSSSYKQCALLHEFSHHLTDHIFGNRLVHSIEFFFVLCEVARWYYKGQLCKYPWNLEYKRIQSWHKKYQGEVPIEFLFKMNFMCTKAS